MAARTAEAAPSSLATMFMVAPGAAAVPRATAAVAPQATVALAKPAAAALNAQNAAVPIPRSSVPDSNLVTIATALAGVAAAAPQIALPASSSIAVGASVLAPGPTLAVVASVGLIAAWRQFAGSQVQEGATVAQAVVPAAAGAVQTTTSAASVATSAGAVVALPLGGSLVGKFLCTRSSAIEMTATLPKPETDPSEGDAPLSRRDLFGVVAAATAFAPLAANADGASSKTVLERARAIYGSRVYRLQKASPEEVIEEKNVFKLFRTGAYRSTADKETTKQLAALEKSILASAKAGDASKTQAGIKEFIAVGRIRELDLVKGGNWDPKQRRNAGAPPTSEIESQMGPQAFALYQPLRPKK